MAVDPLALLRREHEQILDQLGMLETAVGVRRAGGAVEEQRRTTLRELLSFFTKRVVVHFRRESVLISALCKVLGRSPDECGWLNNLEMEHRVLKAEAVGIARRIGARKTRRTKTDGVDPVGIRAFIQRYRSHLASEERILYLLAERRLTEEQRRRAGHRMLEV
jgi:hemerythrin-like domain-containing protein